MENPFCEIYVNTDEPENTFYENVRQLVDGEFVMFEIDAEFMELSVERNDSYGEKFLGGNRFLGFKYILEVDPLVDSQEDLSKYVEQLGKLLVALWNKGYEAVAACEFEDDLPNSGGGRPFGKK